MPNWQEYLNEINIAGSTHDIIRRKYLLKLFEHTKRNLIVYYSGWLQKGELQRQAVPFGINDGDKNGFMAAIHHLDRSKGLDLILHTPGGDMAATESLVGYLRSMFGKDIRAIVPQLAMSGGTMIALSCKEVIMGKHSDLGPVDPQIAGIPAHGIIEEFQRARDEVIRQITPMGLWQPIIAKYNPALVGECEKAIEWANEMVKEWLLTGMFEGHPEAEEKAETVLEEFGNHALTKSHNRHISASAAKDAGVIVTSLEADPILQDLVLTIHHACIQTLAATNAFKIIENHNGIAYIPVVQPIIVQR